MAHGHLSERSIIRSGGGRLGVGYSVLAESYERAPFSAYGLGRAPAHLFQEPFARQAGLMTASLKSGTTLPSAKRDKELPHITRRMFDNAPWAKSRAPSAKSAPPETSKKPQINSMRAINRAPTARPAPLPNVSEIQGGSKRAVFPTLWRQLQNSYSVLHNGRRRLRGVRGPRGA